MALGGLYIQQRLGVTERETVELIRQSPYLQFFIGLRGFQYLKPFDSSMLVHFRKRIGTDLIKVCIDMTKANGIAMIQELLASYQEEKTDAELTELEAIETELGVPPTTLESGSNWGSLILDATIGTSKRKNGVNRILTKLVEISMSIIGMAFFVMNSE